MKKKQDEVHDWCVGGVPQSGCQGKWPTLWDHVILILIYVNNLWHNILIISIALFQSSVGIIKPTWSLRNFFGSKCFDKLLMLSY